ncbi:ROK family protein (plasmid) [Coraliomargarita sp. W4R53]
MPHPTKLAALPMNSFALAVDIGGTKVESALVTPDGHVLAASRNRAHTGRAITPGKMSEALATVIAHTLLALPEDATLVGAGIGSAGPINRQLGTTSALNMPELQRFTVVERVQALLPTNTPVTLGLDGMCIALAEWQLGAGRDINDLLCMVVSTGIGGGLISGGTPVQGPDGNAGHVGQLRVTPRADGASDGPTAGTLESVASGPASVRWAQQNGWVGNAGEDLARDAAAGNEVARKAIVRSARAVGEALAGVAALASIELVVIGGGFSFVADDYLSLVEAHVHASAVLPAAHRLRVVGPQLGDAAPLVGAALLAHGWKPALL